MKIAPALGAFALLTVFSTAGAAQPPEESPLRFNPFAVPQLSATAEGRTRPHAGEEWQPVLRGTLRAGEASLADLGGVVLAIGEETGGYRLLEVSEFSAVFVRNGEQLELSVPTPASVEP